ncbi:hypothetical protein N182_21560 [Sinorhizobium sp. GL2]|nr:hypothetical protein N182_21560 [Sinorhizobium sp. GL2]
MTTGDRIAVLAPLKQAGRSNLMQFGIPEDVYHRPANLFVAKFMGSPPINFFEGRLDGAGVSVGTLSFPGASHLPGDPLVGIRPEHVGLGTGEGPSIVGTVEGQKTSGARRFGFWPRSRGGSSHARPVRSATLSVIASACIL